MAGSMLVMNNAQEIMKIIPPGSQKKESITQVVLSFFQSRV
jgi:hypothetical protein